MTRLTLANAARQVAAAWMDRKTGKALRDDTVKRYIEDVERFVHFSRALGVDYLDEVDDVLATAFINAPGLDRHGQQSVRVGSRTQNLRRSAIRALFREARRLGLTRLDPSLDVNTPPSSKALRRVLSTPDVETVCFYAEQGHPQTRQATVIALLLAGVHSGEIGHLVLEDVGPDAVWVHGTFRTAPRLCPLTDWGKRILAARTSYLRAQDSDTAGMRLAVTTPGNNYHLQARVCTAATDVLTRANLRRENPRANVRSLTVYAAQCIFEETGRIEQVANRLGYRSLDATAELIGYDWINTHGGSQS